MKKNMINKRIFCIIIAIILIGSPVFASKNILKNEENSKILNNNRSTILYVGGTGYGNYTTIQEAIDAASSADTIFIYNGTYYENVEVYKTLNLIGESCENVIVDGGDGSQVIHVTTNYVNITKIQVTNSHHGIHIEYGLYTTIVNCIVTETDYSITPRNSPYTTINNCNLYYNKNVGIRVISSSYSNFTDCSLSNTQSGIFITDSQDCSISNCIAFNISMITLSNGGSGYYFENSPNGIIENSIAYNCSNYGIYILSSATCSITNCDFYNNTWNPDAMFPSWYHSVGICMHNSPDCIITDCTVSNSDNGIYFRTGSSDCILRNNVFINNTEGNFDFLAFLPDDFYQDIDTSNIIDSKPVIYLIDESDLLFDGTDNIGFLGLVSCDNITVKNIDISGILLVDTYNSRISNISTHNCKKGFYIYNSQNCSIINSKGFNNRFGTYGSSDDLINCSFYNNEYGIYLQWEEKQPGGGTPVNGGNVINCVSNDNEIGFFDQKGSYISDCEIYNNSEYGFILSCEAQKPVDGSVLRNNNIHDNFYNFFAEGWEVTGYAYQDVDTSNSVDGKPIYYVVGQQGQIIDGAINDIGLVVLVSCTDMTVQNLLVSGNKHGLLLIDTADSMIRNCDFYNNKDGIWLYTDSINNQIANCNCYNNIRGIASHGSASNQIIQNCHLYNNSQFGFWTQDTQNNKIIGCTINDNGFAYSEEQASYPYSLQYGGPGILIHYITPNNLVENCTIYNNYEGIYVFDDSDAQTIRNCEIYNNTKHGICIRREQSCLVENCTTYDNQIGISLVESTYNTIKNCNTSDNDYGIYITTSSNNNKIYHNNIINNPQNAYDSCVNIWDDDYPSGGNYWSDYTGEDSDGDGIGDTPYPIPGGGNEDRYPLMNPLGLNNPPNVPSDPIPSDGAIDVDISTNISWIGGDPDGDNVTYDIYFGAINPPPIVETEYAYNTYDPGMLDYETTYFWKIISKDCYDATTEGPVWQFTTEFEPPKIPDLDCSGLLNWIDVTPGDTVTGSFTVENIGDPDSLLDWEIDTYPSWGIWSFDPFNGTDLLAGDSIEIDVEVVAPNEQEETFTGEVVLVNSEDPGDTCTIDVGLATPVIKSTQYSFLQLFIERFPKIFFIVRNILGF